MKNTIKEICLYIFTAALFYALTVNGLYPETAMVTSVENDVVTVETFSGNVFHFSGAEDYETGDIVSMVMHSNLTPLVTDDVILKVEYSGFIDS